MIITWYGQSCFKLQNKEDIVLIDSYSPRKCGLRGPNLKAAITIITEHEDKNVIKNLKNKTFLISGPGEYEIKNIFVYGISFTGKSKRLTIYQFEMDGIKFGVLGEIDRILNDRELQGLDGLDVLFIPVGEKNMITRREAMEIINSLEPKIVIPCCFKIPKIKHDLFSVDKFLKETGIKDIEKSNKLLLHKRHLSQEEVRIIVLNLKS